MGRLGGAAACSRPSWTSRRVSQAVVRHDGRGTYEPNPPRSNPLTYEPRRLSHRRAGRAPPIRGPKNIRFSGDQSAVVSTDRRRRREANPILSSRTPGAPPSALTTTTAASVEDAAAPTRSASSFALVPEPARRHRARSGLCTLCGTSSRTAPPAWPASADLRSQRSRQADRHG